MKYGARGTRRGDGRTAQATARQSSPSPGTYFGALCIEDLSVDRCSMVASRGQDDLVPARSAGPQAVQRSGTDIVAPAPCRRGQILSVGIRGVQRKTRWRL